MSIETRLLGQTGEHVTILGYGAMELRGQPRARAIADKDAAKVLNAVLDGGITLIDTSPDYGRSEELIGAYISGRRDEYFLASKCGCLAPPPADAHDRTHDFGRANVRAGVEQSLRRMRTDHVDLVQVHMSPSRQHLEELGTVDELQALRDEGKIRFIGISGTLPNLSDQIAMGVWDTFQIPYSALQREHEDLIAEAAAAGGGTLIRGGAARGVVADDKDWGTRLSGLSAGEGQERWESSGIEDVLDGMPRTEFVLRFTLSHPGLSTTIVGTADLGHLQSNLEVAARGPLPADLYEEAKRRLTRGSGTYAPRPS
jgi:aryl-alcohol dehydrogenase-like predicted oxidoreductase